MDSLNLILKTASSPNQVKVDTRLIVTPQLSHLTTMDKVPAKAAGVAWYAFENTTARDMLVIDGGAAEIPSNTERVEKSVSIVSSRFFNSPYKNLLITHKFYSDSQGSAPVPLFWKYPLLDLADDIDQNTIEILDKEFKTVKGIAWVYDSEENVVYNNLRGEYNQKTGEYSLYFVRYSTLLGIPKTYLLNNEAVFSPATYANIGDEYTYSRTDNGTYYSISITYDATKFAVKPHYASRIYLEYPYTENRDMPWSVRISNGDIKRLASGPDGVNHYTYSIPEYSSQAFNPIPPFRKVVQTEAIPISNNLLYVPYSPIIYDPDNGYHINIVVRNRYGKGKGAFTSDSTQSTYIPHGEMVRSLDYADISDFLSVDSLGGFIYLGPYKVDYDDLVTVDLTYTENFYSLSEIELNPVLNYNILDTILVVFLVPSEGESAGATSFLHWMTIDLDGNIVETDNSFPTALYSETEGVETGYLTTHSYTEFLYDYTASGVYHTVAEEVSLAFHEAGTGASNSCDIYSMDLTVSPADTESIIFSDSTTFSTNKEIDTGGTGVGVNAILDSIGDWGVEDNTLYVNTCSSSTSSRIVYTFEAYNSHQYLVIGECQIREANDPDDIGIFDTRVAGGGIRHNQIQSAIDVQEEVRWYWDIGYWDGEPVPGMATVRVDIPWFVETYDEVWDNVDDILDTNLITEAIDKHQALGEYPIKRIWGPTPILTSWSCSEYTGLVLNWSDEDNGMGVVKYNIYYSTEPNPSEWELYETVSSGATTTCITGLTEATSYFIRIQCSVTMDEWETEREIPNWRVHELKTCSVDVS